MSKTFKQHKLNIPALLLAVVLLVMSLPLKASARGLIDLSVPGDLSLTYRCEEVEGSSNVVAISGAPISIYKVADISANGEYTLIAPYDNISSFPVTDINKIRTQDTWKEVSASIAGYIYMNNVSPSYTVKTDENGLAHFTGIELGLYFVGNVTRQMDDCIYSFSFLLPYLKENAIVRAIVPTIAFKFIYALLAFFLIPLIINITPTIRRIGTGHHKRPV